MTTTSGTGIYVQVQGGSLSRIDVPDGRVLSIPSEPLIVGRSPLCGLPVDDSTVSWTHAQFTATEDRGIHLRDLKSRNGVFVEGVRIVEAYLLATPVPIRIGETLWQYSPGGHVQLDVSTAESFGPLKGDSTAMRRLFATLRQYAAEKDHTILIMGETGTGKELIARALHEAGPRAHKPFITVDCTSLPANLAESALFGHEHGSFTGATKQVSPFVEADGGTIFLDEIGELPLDQQAKLLRVLQEKRIKSIGSNRYRELDVRVIAATLLDLPSAINTRAFRSDLFFRLDQLPVTVPPLRDRPQDIPGLIHHFASETGIPDLASRISPESYKILERYPWPGNVRELQNLVLKATCFPEPGPVRIEKYISSRVLFVPPATRTSTAAIDCVSPNDSESEALRVYWTRMYEQYDGNISKIATYSGTGRAKVRSHLLKYGLIRPEK